MGDECDLHSRNSGEIILLFFCKFFIHLKIFQNKKHIMKSVTVKNYMESYLSNTTTKKFYLKVDF